MRRLPSKAEILERAREISVERAVIHGLPAITPTEAELKETGVFREARLDLMTQYKTAEAEQHRYLADMASELGLKVLRKREHREQMRKVEAFDVFKSKHPRRIVKINGYKIVLPTFPKPKPKPKKVPRVSLRKPLNIGNAIRGAPKQKRIKKAKPKPKKRKKRHVDRNGKTMRKLRKQIRNGKKVFSFPDRIWKVRK